jgi:hypothetical protein
VVDVVWCAAKQKAGRQAGRQGLALIAIGPRRDVAMIALLQISYREAAADHFSGSPEDACMMIIVINFFIL